MRWPLVWRPCIWSRHKAYHYYFNMLYYLDVSSRKLTNPPPTNHGDGTTSHLNKYILIVFQQETVHTIMYQKGRNITFLAKETRPLEKHSKRKKGSISWSAWTVWIIIQRVVVSAPVIKLYERVCYCMYSILVYLYLHIQCYSLVCTVLYCTAVATEAACLCPCFVPPLWSLVVRK